MHNAKEGNVLTQITCMFYSYLGLSLYRFGLYSQDLQRRHSNHERYGFIFTLFVPLFSLIFLVIFTFFQN